MFKNKNIKKFISIVCTILTLNSVTSLSQTKVAALKFDYKKDIGYEYTTVTLEKPFYYITVYDTPLGEIYSKTPYAEEPTPDYNRHWTEIDLGHCVGAGELINDRLLTEVEAPISSCGEELREVFGTADDSNEIALVLALGKAENLNHFPQLPWLLVLTPTPNHLEATEKMRTMTSQERMILPKVKKDGEKYIPCIEVPKRKQAEHRFWTVAIAADRQDVKITEKDEWLREWRKQAKIMTVGELKEWIRDNNQELAQELGLQVNTTKQNKSETTGSEERELKHSVIPGEGNGAGQPITNNILCNTKTFIQKNPKTSVGLGAAIVALVGTIIYKIKKLFTRESQKSQIKNQVHHVKNKI